MVSRRPFHALHEVVRARFSHCAWGRGLDGKIETGRGASRAHWFESDQNPGCSANVLGPRTAQGSLSGLDGVLIGLRTRELLRLVIQARARLAPLILIFEDIHWLDSASEALLASLVAADAPYASSSCIRDDRPIRRRGRSAPT